MIAVLRTNPSFHSSSHTLSLRSTSATSVTAAAASLRSRILASPIALLLVGRSRFRKQQIVDLLFELCGAAVCAGDLIDVDDLGFDPAGMRRQQQDAVADLDGFRNRVSDEQHGEFGFRPKLQQLVLAGTAGERGGGRGRGVPPPGVLGPSPARPPPAAPCSLAP